METNNKKNNDIIEIDLLQLLKALWDHVLIIIVVAVLCALLAFVYTFLTAENKYTSTAQMYVNNSNFSLGATNVSISSSQLSAASDLVNTYVVILDSRTTMEEVIKEAGLPYTYEQFLKHNKISTKQVNDTQVFSVSVTNTDPMEAELVANTIATVLPSRIADVIEGASCRVVDYAIVPSHRSSPVYTKITLTGFLVGFVLACAAIIVLEIMESQSTSAILGTEEIQERYKGIPILGSVPDMRRRPGEGYYDDYYYKRDYAYKQDSGSSSKSKKKKSILSKSKKEVKKNG